MIKFLRILLVIFSCTLIMSCGDQLAELNENPNASTSAGTPELLTSGMAYYGIALDGYFNESDALYAQYWAGGPGVALIDDERYFIEPGDYNNEWAFSYRQALSDLSDVIANGNTTESAIADIYSVMIYQNLVDHYGDIPYSEALKGRPEDGGITTPKYDDAQTIYNDLVTRLDADIEALENTTFTIGSEDLVYQGNLSNWISFAAALKLRLLMRQSITGDAATLGQQINQVINSGLLNGFQMALLPFNGAEGQNYNPQYARRESGIGQFYVASESSTDIMQELNDPRINTLYDPAANTGTIVGMKQGNVGDLVAPSADDFSFPSAVAYGVDNDVILMSTWEVLFLRAEADMRFGTADDEAVMFNSAVTEHFMYVGLSAEQAQDYLSNDVIYDASANQTLKSNIIGIQKWISMNGLQESEGWIESRRFDMPGSNIFTNTSTGIFQTPTRSVFAEGIFPSIRLYPQTELSFNALNTDASRTILDKTFWDN